MCCYGSVLRCGSDSLRFGSLSLRSGTYRSNTLLRYGLVGGVSEPASGRVQEGLGLRMQWGSPEDEFLVVWIRVIPGLRTCPNPLPQDVTPRSSPTTSGSYGGKPLGALLRQGVESRRHAGGRKEPSSLGALRGRSDIKERSATKRRLAFWLFPAASYWPRSPFGSWPPLQLRDT